MLEHMKSLVISTLLSMNIWYAHTSTCADAPELELRGCEQPMVGARSLTLYYSSSLTAKPPFQSLYIPLYASIAQ